MPNDDHDKKPSLTEHALNRRNMLLGGWGQQNGRRAMSV